MISPAFRAAERKRRSAHSRGRKVVASKRQMRDLRDLAHRVGVEVPAVVFAVDAEEATAELHKHLQHLRQPALGEMGW